MTTEPDPRRQGESLIQHQRRIGNISDGVAAMLADEGYLDETLEVEEIPVVGELAELISELARGIEDLRAQLDEASKVSVAGSETGLQQDQDRRMVQRDQDRRMTEAQIALVEAQAHLTTCSVRQTRYLGVDR